MRSFRGVGLASRGRRLLWYIVVCACAVCCVEPVMELPIAYHLNDVDVVLPVGSEVPARVLVSVLVWFACML